MCDLVLENYAGGHFPPVAKPGLLLQTHIGMFLLLKAHLVGNMLLASVSLGPKA